MSEFGIYFNLFGLNLGSEGKKKSVLITRLWHEQPDGAVS